MGFITVKCICVHFILIYILVTHAVNINNNNINQTPNDEKNLARQEFEEFLIKFNKNYMNDLKEKERRFKIFERNLKKISLLNRSERGTASYGVTQFADLTSKEFRQYYTGLKPHLMKHEPSVSKVVADEIQINDLPKQFDWRNVSGVVSEVKNQGMCGSCWAFSATGNIEGQWALAKGQAVSLSEQELVDCDKIDQGCNGGLPSNAYKTIIDLGGIETEHDYPYDGRDEKCNFNRSLSTVKIDSYVVLPQNETLLAQWLYKNGPISIGINANAMQFYFGGISHPLKFLCNPKQLDHGVLIVGFGVGRTRFLKKLEPFWIIKNSWGTGWGEKGYYRVFRGDGTCGLNLMATSAWINK